MKDIQNQVPAQQQHPQADSSQAGNTHKEKELLPSLPRAQHARQKHGVNSSVYLSILVEEHSQLLVHLLGYGLLAFAFIDYIHIVVPLHFTNPWWEVQTMGALVDHAAIPLLGLALVFYRQEGYLERLEKNFLRFLSWVSLLVGVLYLLMLPLGGTDTWRLYHRIEAQITAQVSQQSQQLQKVQDQLNQAKTDEQIQQVLASLISQNQAPEIKNARALKDQFLAQISQAEQSNKIEAKKLRTNQTNALLKNAVKWHIGALVAGTLFILIWHLTSWARKS